jgi:two-component system sensor histidine kinase UhpB
VFSTCAPRPLLWRALATNSAVLTAATLVLAVSPATVSFPIAVAEAFVLAGGLAAMVALNFAVLPRAASMVADRRRVLRRGVD